jgi:hypothetical protein
VHRKALAAVATLLVAAALGACGGGEETTGTTGGTSVETPQASTPEDVQRRAEEVKEERRRQGSDNPERGAGSGSGEDRGEPAPSPSKGHQDSGGGAAQFTNKGSDNSIQEFGREAGDSEMERAAAVLHAYLDARAERRWDDACSHLSAEAVAGIEQFAATFAQDKDIEGCPDVLEALSGSTSDEALKEAAQADVGSLRTEGSRGFLLYHGPRGVDYAVAVVEEGGEWKLASPEATPLL